MKSNSNFFCITLLLFSLTLSAESSHGVAVRVVDGRTLLIADRSGERTVHLSGIEIPPATTAAAKELAERFTAGRSLLIETGVVYRSPDGLSLNEALLEGGVAILALHESRAGMVAAEKSARRREAGIWSRRVSAPWEAEYSAVRSLGIYVPFQPPPKEERSRRTRPRADAKRTSEKPAGSNR